MALAARFQQNMATDCVKASQINDRKARRIELILRALRTLILDNFHASPLPCFVRIELLGNRCTN